jgi:thioredoxin 1
MSNTLKVTARTFAAEVQNSAIPVLIDFYADWCGPCRMLAPTLDKLATEFSGRVKIVKVNVDEEPELAQQFRVSSIPQLSFVVNGRVVGQAAGLVGEAPLRRTLTQLAEMAGSRRRVG